MECDLKKKISDLLMHTLSYAYCDNCNCASDSAACDDCHRKYQNWRLGQHVADGLADEILKMCSDASVDAICSACL